MNDYKLLKRIFTNFTVDDEKIPVEYIKYKGKKKTYEEIIGIGGGFNADFILRNRMFG